MRNIIITYFIFFASASLAQDQTQQTLEGHQGWYQQNSSTTDDLSLLTFINSDTGYAGAIYTTNGGDTWQPYLQPVNVIQFVDSLHGWGFSSKGDGWLSLTTNGGQTWEDDSTG